MDDAAKERIAHNETLFRDANEAIERGLWPGEEASAVRFRCECSRLDCGGAVELRVDDYERVRRHPQRFIVLEGHVTPEVEVVVDRRPGYLVVEKRGAAGEVAASEDPRS